ncbi:MAG: GxxExxY protein [Planctomycetota bacterium]
MGLDQGNRIESLAHEVVGAAIEVHRHIGPGQLESTYHRALEIELRLRDIRFQSEVATPITYKGHPIGDGRVDVLAGDNEVLLELKAVDQLAPIHEAQIIAYLKNTGCPIGFLINFNVPLLKEGLRRFANTRNS